MRTYNRLYRFLSSYPDVTLSEEFKKKDMATFEKYLEGSDDENSIKA